jgi:hypothetical protein
MRIRFSIIRPDIHEQVRTGVDELRDAVNAGDMDRVDAATAKLIALTADCHSVDLSEEQWRGFLDGSRQKLPEFQSGYLLSGEVCSDILPTVGSDDHVLELPIDEDAEKEEPDV